MSLLIPPPTEIESTEIFLDSKQTLESMLDNLSDAAVGKIRFESLQAQANYVEQLKKKILATTRQQIAENTQKHHTDSLTGLKSRAYFDEVLSPDIYLRDARNNKRVTVCYLDLDRFKEINDTYGHSKGDDILKYAAKALTNSTRQTDILVRKGGDEFIIYLPEIEHQKAIGIARKVNSNLKLVDVYGNPLSASIGVFTYDHPSTKSFSGITEPFPRLNDLVEIADSLMYQAKKQGHNGQIASEQRFSLDYKKK